MPAPPRPPVDQLHAALAWAGLVSAAASLALAVHNWTAIDLGVRLVQRGDYALVWTYVNPTYRPQLVAALAACLTVLGWAGLALRRQRAVASRLAMWAGLLGVASLVAFAVVLRRYAALD